MERTSITYPDEWTIGRARDHYFAAYGLSTGGYDEKWVKLKMGPLALYFPNTKSRLRSVRLHDIHHVITEYSATWVGEAEISAWELGAGCGDHYAAWVLDVGGVALGLLIAPRRTYRAWKRGRASRSLYDREYGDDMLERTVGEMRAELGLSPAAPA
jgi:hypothetical protein